MSPNLITGILVAGVSAWLYTLSAYGKPLKIFAIVFGVLGVITAIQGARQLALFFWIKKNGQFAKGQLIDIKLIKNLDVTYLDTVWWKLTVEWIHPNGKKYICTVHQDLTCDPFENGFINDKNNVHVKYNPQNPSESILVFDKHLPLVTYRTNGPIIVDSSIHLSDSGRQLGFIFPCIGALLLAFVIFSSKDFTTKIFAGVIGSVFICGGLYMLDAEKKMKLRIANILAYGNTITGKITFCGFDKSTFKNTATTWKIEAEWVHPVTKKIYRARTFRLLKNDPASKIPVDGFVQIKYLPQNPNECVIAPNLLK